MTAAGIVDISVPIRAGMVTWPGDPDVVVERVASIAGGDDVNMTRLALGAHTATHVDAPLHFIDGAPAVEGLDLDALVGPAHVVPWEEDGDVAPKALDGLAPGAARVLFRTRNSTDGLWGRGAFAEDHVAVSPAAAARLVALGVRLVGVDYLSVGDPETHRVLLGAGVVVLEGLDLRAVEPGAYELVCLPLRVLGADGAPARALLVR